MNNSSESAEIFNLSCQGLIRKSRTREVNKELQEALVLKNKTSGLSKKQVQSVWEKIYNSHNKSPCSIWQGASEMVKCDGPRFCQNKLRIPEISRKRLKCMVNWSNCPEVMRERGKVPKKKVTSTSEWSSLLNYSYTICVFPKNSHS